tara:strand:+ start:248 stop:631 length:384 start_codon:yes stop_codon:yes gene_type:complete
MIAWVIAGNIYGESYSTSGYTVGYPGYTGRYTMVFLLVLVVYYSLWIGVQLPQGIYVSYGRGYILVSIGCNIGYTPEYQHHTTLIPPILVTASSLGSMRTIGILIQGRPRSTRDRGTDAGHYILPLY